jgi:hypothetical protein
LVAEENLFQLKILEMEEMSAVAYSQQGFI